MQEEVDAAVATVVSSDDALAAQLAAGDAAAFATLYQRYFQAVYDFVQRTVRDPVLAEDVVQTTFVRAWERPPQRDGSHNLKAWLFTVARNAALDELRKRSRETQTSWDEHDEERPHFAAVDLGPGTNPQARAQTQESADLVWNAASALSADEYSLLDMHLRQELKVDEIATALGLRKGAVYTRLSRLRDALEGAVRGRLLALRGRHACADLDGMLTAADQQWSEMVERRVTAHADACEICAANRDRFASPEEIFTGLSLIGVVPGLQSGVWDAVTAQIGFGPGGSSAATSGGAAAATGGGGTGPSAWIGSVASQIGHGSVGWWGAATMTVKVGFAAGLTSAAVAITATALLVSRDAGPAHEALAPPGTAQGSQQDADVSPDPQVPLAESVATNDVAEPASGEGSDGEARGVTAGTSVPAAIDETGETHVDPGAPSEMPEEVATYQEAVQAILVAYRSEATAILEQEATSEAEIANRQRTLVDQFEVVLGTLSALQPPSQFADAHGRFLILAREIVDARRALLDAISSNDLARGEEMRDRLHGIGRAMGEGISPEFFALFEGFLDF